MQEDKQGDRYFVTKEYGGGVVAVLRLINGRVAEVPARWDSETKCYRSMVCATRGKALSMYNADMAAQLATMGVHVLRAENSNGETC
jgi:hypothetical protein